MARVALALLDGGTPAASDIRQINAAARWSATLVPMLEARTLSAGWRGTERVRAALGRVAVDAIDLFAHRRERLMRCELAGCGGLLLSNPRGPRRRWCSMEACGNAAKVAAMLLGHDQIERVWYPGLETHPNHKVALDQMRGFGGMVSVEVKGGAAHAKAFVEKTKVFTLAESLGGVESLIELPAQMTHMSTSGSLLEIPDNLVRLSVGIEDADDLLEDLRQALS